MSQTAEPSGVSSPAYGNYILRTGRGVVADVEQIYGAHWYHTRFVGKKPILDLGPGRCWFTRQDPEHIVAVDNSPELVEHYRLEGINIRLGEAYAIPFPDEYFEGIFCCWLLEHLADPVRAMTEMRRVLKPGGYACVVVPTPHDMVAFYDDYTHIRPFTTVSLVQLAEDCGFAKHKVECLLWVRGVKLVLGLGASISSKYFRFCDSIVRQFGLVNRNNLMLEVWK